LTSDSLAFFIAAFLRSAANDSPGVFPVVFIVEMTCCSTNTSSLEEFSVSAVLAISLMAVSITSFGNKAPLCKSKCEAGIIW
jgi:hypothetical protein